MYLIPLCSSCIRHILEMMYCLCLCQVSIQKICSVCKLLFWPLAGLCACMHMGVCESVCVSAYARARVVLVPVETMPVTDRSQCHGKAGPQGHVVHFNGYFQTAGKFLRIGNGGLAVLPLRCYPSSSVARPEHVYLSQWFLKLAMLQCFSALMWI